MLSLRTLRGASWTITTRLAGRGVDFVTLLILARTLGPADFGLVALALSLIAIIDIVLEVPIAQALTRLPEVTRAHLDTAFTLGLLRGLFIGLLVALAAWPMTIFYHDPKLLAVTLVIALGPIFRSLYSPAMAKYYRGLNFQYYFFADFGGKLVATGLALAVLHAQGGYWAIVTNSIASSIVPTLVSYALAPYRPRISLAAISDFSGFIGWFSSSQILAAFNWQFDRVFLGYHLPKTELGQYTVASDFAVLPTQSVIGPAMQPVFAAFAQIHDDRPRLQAAFLKVSKLTMLIAAPAAVGIALTSDLIVSLALGPAWSDAGQYLALLSLAVLLIAYYQPTYSLCLALDRPRNLFVANLIDLAIRLAAVPAGYAVAGIDGVIYARILLSVVMFVLSTLFVRNLIALPVGVQLRNLWQVVASCVIMAVGVCALRQLHIEQGWAILAQLASVAAAGALLYVACLYALGVRVRSIV
ncbi:hypothetical protein VQ03_25465 [Methylobacterium tarhaniae]|uniref:Uncharacterized protein n=1 Tax=Methylobacterium tarhaniae TaxID=1187852 RepID=A0A0J6V2X7_9HYPH|nr:lipopolysaccharide biosynthesis protein [Methylobacterium tarhaniae]KMO33196.1 hypothetical protein VQ03_25465 [Methylobacterium tarhaniae]